MAMLVDMIENTLYRPEDPSARFTGKTILITGATSGIGFHAARSLVALDAKRVILAVRSTAKGEAVRKEIEASTGRQGVVEVMELDMQSYASIQNLVEKVDKQVERLDAVILNAGVMEQEYGRSVEGWENTLQVNTISTVLLALLLLPKLATGKGAMEDLPRLISVSSVLYRTVGRKQIAAFTRGGLKALSTKSSSFSGLQQYSMSKLLALCFMRELAATTMLNTGQQPKVLVAACCPGLCSSDLFRSFSGGLQGIAISMSVKLFAKKPKVGSRTLMTALGLGADAQGGFWQRGSVVGFKPLVSDGEGRELQKRVWKEIIGELEASGFVFNTYCEKS